MSLSLQSSAQLTGPGGQNQMIAADQPEQTRHLASLLGSNVTACHMDADNTLVLAFSNGQTLSLLASNELPESYVLWQAGEYLAI